MSIHDLAAKALAAGLERVESQVGKLSPELVVGAVDSARKHLDATGELEPAAAAGLDALEAAAPELAGIGREELRSVIAEVHDATVAEDFARFDGMSFADLIADEEQESRAAIAAEHAKRERRAALVGVAKVIGKAAASKLLPLLLAAL